MTAIEKFELADSTYERLMQQHHAKLKSHAMRLTRNRADSEDLYQDTCIKIFMNMDKMKDARTFCNWGMRIMQRLYLDKKRYDARRPQTTSFDELNAHFGCEVEFEDKKTNIEAEVMLDMVQNLKSHQVRSMISSLTPEYSSALSMATYGTPNSMDILGSGDALSYQEIAKISNSQVGTVRSRLHRARKALELVAKNVEIGRASCRERVYVLV